MNKLKTCFLICGYLFLMQNIGAQNRAIDSLTVLLRSDKKDTNCVNYSILLCSEYIKINKRDTALVISNRVLELSRKLNYKKGIASAYRGLGRIYADQNKNKDAVQFYISASQLFNEQKLFNEEALCYKEIFKPYMQMGDYTNALKFQIRALGIQKKLNNKLEVGQAYLNMGAVSSKFGNKTKAIDYLDSAKTIYSSVNNFEGVLKALQNIAGVNIQLNQYDKAIEFANEALILCKKFGNKEIESKCYQNLGVMNINRGNYKEAIKHLLISEKITHVLNDSSRLEAIYQNLGVVYAKLNDFNNAKIYFNKSLEKNIQQGNVREICDSYQNIVYLDSVLQQWEDGFMHQRLWLKYRDTIYQIDSDKNLTEMVTKYEVEKKDAQIKLLEKEKQVASYRRKILLILIGVTVVVLIWLVFRVRKYRKDSLIQKRLSEFKLTQSQLKAKQTELELEKTQLITQQKEQELIIHKEKLEDFINTTVHQAQLLENLKLQLEDLKNQDTEKLSSEYVLKVLKENINPNRYWEEFIVNFNLVYKQFFVTLTTKFPDLNNNELNLCALIKCNLGNREIANVLNISPDSAKKAKFRLKKKLNLGIEDDLSSFFDDF